MRQAYASKAMKVRQWRWKMVRRVVGEAVEMGASQYRESERDLGEVRQGKIGLRQG